LIVIIVISIERTVNNRSKQRDAIVRVLRNTTSHPTAERVYEQVKKELPGVGLATIYRNLRLLSEAGEIAEIATKAGTNHFDGNAEQHYHFRCDRCGSIHDLDEPVDKAIEDRVATKTGFIVTGHYVELGGLCLSCQRLGVH
jgi:Fur family peroxide stress response transcriptional regulator